MSFLVFFLQSANICSENKTEPFQGDKQEEKDLTSESPSKDVVQPRSIKHQALDDPSGSPSLKGLNNNVASNACENSANTTVPIRDNPTREDTSLLIDNAQTQENTLLDDEQTQFAIDVTYSTTPKMVVPNMGE